MVFFFSHNRAKSDGVLTFFDISAWRVLEISTGRVDRGELVRGDVRKWRITGLVMLTLSFVRHDPIQTFAG